MGPERASQLMSATVKDQQGNAVGQINDFVINPASGRIQFAVISLSDQSGKLAAVPWALIRSGSEPNSCTLNVSKQKLDSSQTFDASSWPDFSQPSTSQQIYSYYGVQPGHYGAGGNAPTGGNESGGSSSSSQPDQSSPGGQNPGSQNPGTPSTPPQH
jgi:PRC-barrel domain